MRRKTFVVLTSLVALTSLASAGQREQRKPLPHSLLPHVARAQTVGTPSPSEIIHLTVSLAPRYPRELQAFCDSVSDPRSPNYRQFLTPQQVGEQFGAAPTDVQNAAAFLKSNGLKIRLIAPNRMAILATGSAAQIQTAFGTQLKRLRAASPTTGRLTEFRSNITPLTVPANLSKTITNVFGLDNLRKPTPRQVLTPGQARTLYGNLDAFNGGFRGEGVTIGITNFDGLRLSNSQLYIQAHALPIPPGGAGSNIEIIPVGTPANAGFCLGEGDLDFQMVLGAAPLANIKIYDSVDDLIGILAQQSSDNEVDIVTESWGHNITLAEATAAHNQHLSLTAQGITYMCASGDNGTNFMGYDYPNFDPEVLMVGGTAATTDAAGIRISEVGWNGSGSGWSEVNAPFNVRPAWQVGNGVPTNVNKRLLPDLALHASGGQHIGGGAGYLVYVNGEVTGLAGTSAASPQLAGQLAIMAQRLQANGQGLRLGRIQDLVYSQNGRTDIWFDILSGNTGFLPDGTIASAKPGWDYVCGWGPPNLDALYVSLAQRNVSGTVTLQNFSGSVAGTTVTVQLYQAGTATLVDSETVALGTGGAYTISTSAPAGSYDVYIKASHWLRRKVAGVTIATSGPTGVNASLVNGDVTGDNTISLGDFAQLRNAFGSGPGSLNWNPAADLNGDLTVSLGDFAILRTNFGQSGD